MGRRQRLEELRRDRGAVLDAYVGMTAEALEGLTAEERNKLYKILKLRVVVRDDGTPEVRECSAGPWAYRRTGLSGNETPCHVVPNDKKVRCVFPRPYQRGWM